MRMSAVFALVIGLSGCGTAYISPSVPTDDPNVDVISITPATLAKANQSPYVPRQLPAAFFQTAGGGSGLRGAGASPQPANTPQVRPEALPINLPPSAPNTPYRMGVGDVVLLATPTLGAAEDFPTLNTASNARQGYTIQDDGAIAIPNVGRVAIAGQTLQQAEAAIAQRLVENQIDPQFSIEVSEFNSARVSVGGAVASPQVVPITLSPLTLEEALAQSGGFSAEDEAFASIRLYRDGTLYQVPLDEYLKRPSVQKTRLAPGDSVFVDTAFELAAAQAYFQEQIRLAEFKQRARILALDELNAEVSLRRAALSEARSNFQARLDADAVARDYVYLTGELARPGRFALPFARQANLADALYAEGALSTQTADPRQIYVLRAQGSGGRVAAWHLDITKVTNLVLATQFELRPNDIVFVAEQPVTRWNRVIQQITPTVINTSVAAVN